MGPVVKPEVRLSPLHAMVLDALKVESLKHGSRTLKDHLVGTASILSSWNEPEAVISLGLFHSIYSTPLYRQAAASSESRPMLAELLGEAIESRIFAFSQLGIEDVAESLRGTTSETVVSRPKPLRGGRVSAVPSEVFLPRSQAEDFMIVHIANLIEQDRSASGAPGVHLCKCAGLARLLTKRAPYLKENVFCDIGLHEEMRLRDLYREALCSTFADRLLSIDLLDQAIRLAPFIPEPWAVKAALINDEETRSSVAKEAESLFLKRGTNWDKRLSIAEWLAVAQGSMSLPYEITCPEYRVSSRVLPQRFYRYMSRISHEGPGKLNSGWYPELPASPVHDSNSVPLSGVLEEHFDVIQEEVDSLPPDGFHAEAEPIKRIGRWEVLMLFEAGRKNVEVCRRLPKLTALLEASPDVRTSAGLIYLSRLLPHTRVSAHRGGTNSRLRLHLGLRIPDGDCGMRVDDITLSWEKGKTLVFDDFYEHEVWNNTDQERLILLVDVWHPELTAEERVCLDAISKQIAGGASSRSRYWEAIEQRKQEARERSLAEDPHGQLVDPSNGA